MKQLRIKTTTSAALFGIFSGGFLSSCAAEKEKGDNEVSKESEKAKPLPPGNKMRYYDEKSGKYWWYEKQSGESYWEKVDFNGAARADRCPFAAVGSDRSSPRLKDLLGLGEL